MKRKEYEAKRKALLNEAQGFIDEGKTVEAKAKMDEVKALDEAWDAIAQAAADLSALSEEPKPFNAFNYGGSFGETEEHSNESDVVKAWKSDEYKNAWAKTLMGKELSNKETEAFKLVNEAFTHTTKNTGVVIPENVARGIWEIAGEMYPYFADITKTYVNGVLSIIQEDTSSEAGWYEDGVETEDGKEIFKEFKLNGCELSRNITISWKLKEMAIEDFIPYIQRKLAKKMGAAAGYGATHGAGASEQEPTGVITALEAEENTPQVVLYAAGSVPTYQNVLAARAKIKSGYGKGLAVYANSETIWNKLAAIVDLEGRPLFVPDVTNQGVFRILGMPVKEDDSMKAGEILISNAAEGYHENINKEVTILPEDHVKQRKTDYCGYAVMDGNVTTTKAHAILKEEEVPPAVIEPEVPEVPEDEGETAGE